MERRTTKAQRFLSAYERLRTESGVTAAQIAQRMGVSYVAVRRWVNQGMVDSGLLEANTRQTRQPSECVTRHAELLAVVGMLETGGGNAG